MIKRWLTRREARRWAVVPHERLSPREKVSRRGLADLERLVQGGHQAIVNGDREVIRFEEGKKDREGSL